MDSEAGWGHRGRTAGRDQGGLAAGGGGQLGARRPPAALSLGAWILGTGFLGGALAGCCLEPTRDQLGRWLPTRDPDSALAHFVASVEVGHWGDAYERLSASTREKVSFTKFRLGLPFLKHEATGVPVLEILQQSIARRTLLYDPELPADLALVQVIYSGVDAEERPLTYIVRVVMIDEAEEFPGDWKVGLVETMERLAAMAP